MFDWRWVIWEKSKLEEILEETQPWTSRLKDILQLTITSNFVAMATTQGPISPVSTKLANDRTADILDLKPHLRLIELRSGADDVSTAKSMVILPIELSAA